MPLVPRCDVCACWLRYEPKPLGERTGEIWFISYTCPGCGVVGSHYGTEYSPEEAQALASTLNLLSGTPEAAREAARWQERVRTQAEEEARGFSELFASRFPAWEPYLTAVPPEAERTREELPNLEWDCAAQARIPSENPSVEDPLVVEVLNGEVRISWGPVWHMHVYRNGPPLFSPEHLHRAVEVLEWIATEERVICVAQRGEKAVGGCWLLPGALAPHPWDALPRNTPLAPTAWCSAPGEAPTTRPFSGRDDGHRRSLSRDPLGPSGRNSKAPPLVGHLPLCVRMKRGS